MRTTESYDTRSVAASPAREEGGDINGSLDSMEGAIKSLTTRIDGLISRLEPVSHQRPPSPVASRDSIPQPMRSAVANRVMILAEVLESYESKIRDASELLQV